MFPKLRIIVVAVFATCAAVLALSAGMLGARNPGNDLAGVPEVSRALMRQAIAADPDRQQVQVLAYSRRADELLRLRELPVPPARAVADFAEEAQARAAETATVPAAPGSATAPATAASESAPTTVASTSAATPAAAAPAAPVAAALASPPTDTPAAVAMAPVTNPRGDTTAATPVVPPARPPAPAVAAASAATPADVVSTTAPEASPAPTTAPAKTPAGSPAAIAPSGDAKVAAVQTGASETAEIYGPEKPKAGGKPRRPAKVAHPHPPKAKKKTQATVTNPRAPPVPLSGFAAAPTTGFVVNQPGNQPNNRNTTLGNQPTNRNTMPGWRYDNTARSRPAPSTPVQ